MSAAKRDDWADEKTVANAAPGTSFKAAESGTRSSFGSIYDEDEHDPLADTSIRDVPSAILRAAADPDGTLEVGPGAGPMPERPEQRAIATVRPAAPAATRAGSLTTAIAAGALIAVTLVGLAIAAVRWLH